MQHGCELALKAESAKCHYLYITTNTVNGKRYIGQHVTRSATVSDMMQDGYLGSGTLLMAAFRKYGRHMFAKEIIALCDTQEEIDWLEVQMIDELRVLKRRNHWYNRSGGGQYGRSENHSVMMSAIMKRLTNTPEYRIARWGVVAEKRERSQEDRSRGMMVHLRNTLLRVKKAKVREWDESEEGQAFHAKYRSWCSANNAHLVALNEWQKTPLGKAAMREALKGAKRGHEWSHESKMKHARTKADKLPNPYYHHLCIDAGVLPSTICRHFPGFYSQGRYVRKEKLREACARITKRALSHGVDVDPNKLADRYLSVFGEGECLSNL